MNKISKPRSCPGCGHTEFARDHQASAGDLLCQNCGMVQEENPIVSEVQFGESASGAAMVQGAMVGADQTRAFSMRNSLESREQTLMSAKHKIQKTAHAMRIPDYIVDSACGWFKLALVQNFVQGRRSQNVIAACLYVACRHEKTHHLLIDFSSRLQISVYSLGATYLKLVRALQIQKVPLADPSLFIQHFAERLSFGEHTAKVCKDASKIATRMASDWIYEGRRPAGIAGACLLLAARMNNFRRTHAEIVAVAHVGEETLQKRLNEFKKTSSAKLSIQGFRESANTNDSMPPSFSQNRSIETKIRKLLQQRDATLKRYKQLAMEKQLFEKLRIVPKEVDLVEERKSKSKTSETNREDNAEVAEDSDEEADTSMNHDDGVSSTVSSGSQAPKEAGEGGDSQSDSEGEASAGKDMDLFVDANDGAGSATTSEEEVAESGEVVQDKAKEGEEDVGEEQVEVNPLFVPSSDEEAVLDNEDDGFGYEDLPNTPKEDDLDYELHHRELFLSISDRRLRSTTRRKRNRLERIDTSSNIPKASSSAERTKLEKLRRKEEERLARHDALLKSVLDGGDIKESDLEIALDKILEGHKKSLDNLLYRTPAEQKENDEQTDFSKQFEIDCPKNLVKNCPTTAQILAKVRDDEVVDDLDDDDEVLNIKLDPEEVQQKERIWIGLNHDFLIAQEKKRLKMEADELTGNTSGRPRKRKRVKEQTDPLLDDSAVANAIMLIGEDGNKITPAESAKQMLQRKLFSRKINYGSMDELFRNDN